MSEGLRAALKEWVKTATESVYAVSDGSALNFKGLDYGYYVVTTTQGEQAISVDSTMPDVTIVDKNSSTPSNLEKKVDNGNVNIGDTVTYTAVSYTHLAVYQRQHPTYGFHECPVERKHMGSGQLQG